MANHWRFKRRAKKCFVLKLEGNQYRLFELDSIASTGLREPRDKICEEHHARDEGRRDENAVDDLALKLAPSLLKTA